MKGTLFKVKVDGLEVKFQADSGSDVSLLSRKNFEDLEIFLKELLWDPGLVQPTRSN